MDQVKELVNSVCTDNNLNPPSQMSFEYDFKNNLKSLKKIGELKLEIKELEFLMDLNKELIEEKEVDVERGQSEGGEDPKISPTDQLNKPLVNNQIQLFKSKIKKCSILLTTEIDKVKNKLNIDLTDKLNLRDLNKLRIIKAFVSFESPETMHKFKKLNLSKVITQTLLYLYFIKIELTKNNNH